MTSKGLCGLSAAALTACLGLLPPIAAFAAAERFSAESFSAERLSSEPFIIETSLFDTSLALALAPALEQEQEPQNIPLATPTSFNTMLAQQPKRLLLDEGRYACGQTLAHPIALIAKKPGTVMFDCEGVGSGLLIDAVDVTLDGLSFSNFGGSLFSRDAAVALLPGAHRVTLANLSIDGPGFGVHAEEADFLEVHHSDIQGDNRLHLLDRGDGIHLKNAKAARIAHNRISKVRDGIYLENTEGSEVIANQLAELQYGVHTMYSRDELITLNQTNSALGGYALMSSSALRLENNTVFNAADFGVLLNVTKDSDVIANLASHVKANAEGNMDIFSVGKGLFIYDAQQNLIKNNHFLESDVGVAIAMGAESNRFHGNVIASNAEELRYTGTVAMDWSDNGQGNYWAGYRGIDLNGDGIGDSPYRPNDRFDRLFLIYPEARTLMQSPLVMLLKSLSDALALERGEGVTDPYPMMSPPPLLSHHLDTMEFSHAD